MCASLAHLLMLLGEKILGTLVLNVIARALAHQNMVVLVLELVSLATKGPRARLSKLLFHNPGLL